MTIWRDIPGYPYEVSDDGSIRRTAAPNARTRVGKVLSPARPDTSGYYAVRLYPGDGSCRGYRVHRLVAEAFLGPPPSDSHEVNHKNGDKLDNRAENLQWVTRRENTRHAVELKLQPTGADHRSRTRLSDNDVRDIRSLAGQTTHAEIADKYDIHTSTVWRIVHGHRRASC